MSSQRARSEVTAGPSPFGSQPAAGHGTWAAIVLVLLGAFALRALVAGRQGLWADEVFSLAMATGHSLEHPASTAQLGRGDFVEQREAVAPREYAALLRHETPPAGLARVVQAVRRSDTSPPLYYLLLHEWTLVLGTSDLSLRLFSIACALAAAPFLLALARRAGGAPAMSAVAALFSLSPACIFYSVEGRMYSLLWLLAAAWLWATERLRACGPRALTFAFWALSGAAGLWTHYFFIFGWSASVAWLMVRPGKVSRGAWALGAVVVLGSVFPWYRQIPALLSAWRITGDWLTLQPHGYRPIVTHAQLLWSYFSIRGVWGVGVVWDILNLASYGALACLAWLALRRRSGQLRPTGVALPIIWSLAAVAGVIAFDVLRGTYAAAVPRYALTGLPAALLVVALALGRLGPRARGVLLIFLSFLCLVGDRRIWLDPHRQASDYRAIGETLAREARPGDVVIIHSIPSGVCGVSRYLESALGSAGPLPSGAAVTGPTSGEPRAKTKETPPVAAWVGQLGERRMPGDLEALLAGRSRALLVYVHAVGDPPTPYRWLLEHAHKVETRVFADGAIHYFVPSEGEAFPRG